MYTCKYVYAYVCMHWSLLGVLITHIECYRFPFSQSSLLAMRMVQDFQPKRSCDKCVGSSGLAELEQLHLQSNSECSQHHYMHIGSDESLADLE